MKYTYSGASVSRACGEFKIDDCCGPGPACAWYNSMATYKITEAPICGCKNLLFGYA